MRLSPLNFSGLIANGVSCLPELEPADAPKNEARMVSAYACPVCDCLYRDEEDAEECCDPDELSGSKHPEDARITCPICAAECDDERDAAGCCLWKDLDAPTCWRIADAVEAGASWRDAMTDAGVL